MAGEGPRYADPGPGVCSTPLPTTPSSTAFIQRVRLNSKAYAPLFQGIPWDDWSTHMASAHQVVELHPPRQACASIQRDIFKSERYAVARSWFQRILAWCGLEPTVDAFADSSNALLHRFWDTASDALAQKWANEVLWMNPPFSMLSDVLDKIVAEEATGILVYSRLAAFCVVPPAGAHRPALVGYTV